MTTHTYGTLAASHDCGLCDGTLRYAGQEGDYATWECVSCGWWHIAKDCCHVMVVPA